MLIQSERKLDDCKQIENQKVESAQQNIFVAHFFCENSTKLVRVAHGGWEESRI